MTTKFPPPSPKFIRARHQGGPQKPKAIVLHGTVSSDNKGTAINIARWWAGPTSPMSSAHYVVDPGTVIQCVGDHSVAYHCGFNQDSLGVEFCDEQTGPATRWADEDSTAILKRAATLVAKLCLAYGIEAKRPTTAELKRKGPHGIYGHNDSRLAFGGTTHTDPRDFPWEKFLRMVNAEIKRIREAANPPRKTFRVLHAPLHGASATKPEMRKALRRRFARVGFSEAWRQAGWLEGRLRWRAITGKVGNKDERGREVEREVVLMVRRGRKHLEHAVVKIAEAARPLKIAPPRYMAYSVDLMHGEPLATIALHPHAAVRNDWDSVRAEEYRKSMRILIRTVRHLREKYGPELAIIIQGDLNYPNVDDDVFMAPRAVFRRLRMDYVTEGLDWVVYSRNLQVVSKRIIGQAENGQDHPWIEVEFARA